MSIESRVERLERSNRRLRAVVVVLSVVVVSGITIAAQVEDVSKNINTRQLRIVDAKGGLRMALSAYPSVSTFACFDVNANSQFTMTTSPSETSLTIHGDDDKRAIVLAKNKHGHGIYLYDRKDQTRIALMFSPKDDRSGLVLFDKNAEPRWATP